MNLAQIKTVIIIPIELYKWAILESSIGYHDKPKIATCSVFAEYSVSNDFYGFSARCSKDGALFLHSSKKRS